MDTDQVDEEVTEPQEGEAVEGEEAAKGDEAGED